MFTPQKSTVVIDLQNPTIAATALVAEARPLITQLLNELENNTLDSSQFPFTAVKGSGLSKKVGLYAIANTKTKKIYLGGASDLSQRKGDHHRAFTEPTKSKTGTQLRLSKPVLDDLANGSINDFCFVSILILEPTQVTNFSTDGTQNQQINSFLDKEVEAPLLAELFTSKPDRLYNTKTVGVFLPGNTAGGSPASGISDKPLSYILAGDGKNPPREYAWESVSALARCFKVDRNSVKYIRDNSQKVKAISTADFNSFQGTKITNANAAEFEDKNKAEYVLLIRELFPKKAKERSFN